MPDTVAIVVASFIGGAVVAIINWIARRRLTKAETEKKASEIWLMLSGAMESRIEYLEKQACQQKKKVAELTGLLLQKDIQIEELQEQVKQLEELEKQVKQLRDRLRKYEQNGL